jgi:hypothetical protein
MTLAIYSQIGASAGRTAFIPLQKNCRRLAKTSKSLPGILRYSGKLLIIELQARASYHLFQCIYFERTRRIISAFSGSDRSWRNLATGRRPYFQLAYQIAAHKFYRNYFSIT